MEDILGQLLETLKEHSKILQLGKAPDVPIFQIPSQPPTKNANIWTRDQLNACREQLATMEDLLAQMPGSSRRLPVAPKAQPTEPVCATPPRAQIIGSEPSSISPTRAPRTDAE